MKLTHPPSPISIHILIRIIIEMVDLVFGMHSHWDGLQKTNVGRLRRWYSFSNWVLRRAAKVPSSIIGLGLRFSQEMLEERAHWKVELWSATATPIYIIFIPNYITEASSRSVLDCFNFSDDDDLKKLNGAGWVWLIPITAPPRLIF